MEAAKEKTIRQIFPPETRDEASRSEISRNEPDPKSIRYVAPIGRLLYSAIFIFSSFGHFTQSYVNMAGGQGVPLPEVLVPLSGVLALVGGLSVLLGYRARLGALLLILFLVPVTLIMHNFWAVSDPILARMQEAFFMKNISMLGGALLILHFGAGPISLDSQKNPRTLQNSY